jgi:hypothetical protein
LLIIILLFTSCASENDNDQKKLEDALQKIEYIQTNGENAQENTEKGEDQMAQIDYMSEKEFIEFVSTRNLNVTIE